MTYILDTEGDYTKKCETEGCPNEILIGMSRCFCKSCIDEKDVASFKIVPYFEQKVLM